MELRPDPRPLLLRHDTRRRQAGDGARAARGREEDVAELDRRLERHGRRGHQGRARAGHPEPEAEARGRRPAGVAAAVHLRRQAAARRRRQALPREDRRLDRRQAAAGRRHGRARGVSEGRRSVGDAVRLACGSAEGAGGRRTVLRACEPHEGPRLRSLRRYAQPGLRRARRRGWSGERCGRRDEGTGRPLQRQGRGHALLLHLRRPHGLGRRRDGRRRSLPRSGRRPVRHALALPRVGPCAVRRSQGREAVEALGTHRRTAGGERHRRTREDGDGRLERRVAGDVDRLAVARPARASLDLVHARTAAAAAGDEDDDLRRRRLADLARRRAPMPRRWKRRRPEPRTGRRRAS